MNHWTVFRNQAKHIYSVTETKGELNRTTGTRPTTYQYKRVLALLGTKNYGFSMHLNLDESMIVLEEEADLVVIGSQAYKAELKGSLGGLFVHKIDKVTGNELRLIVDSIPTTVGNDSFLI